MQPRPSPTTYTLSYDLLSRLTGKSYNTECTGIATAPTYGYDGI